MANPYQKGRGLPGRAIKKIFFIFFKKGIDFYEKSGIIIIVKRTKNKKEKKAKKQRSAASKSVKEKKK